MQLIPPSLSAEPVPDEAALLIGKDCLVIADLHIGIEVELRQSGFFLPSQAGNMLSRLRSILASHDIRRLVILGDVKHNVPVTSDFEKREVPRFFEGIEGMVEEIDLVPGNHDGNVRSLLPKKVAIHSSRGFKIQEFGLNHGHTWPSAKVMESSVLLLGHNHPIILFIDKLGFKSIRRCWVRLDFVKRSKKYAKMPKEAIVLPSFNEYCGGIPFNEENSKLLGPLMNSRFFKLRKARIHLLDGTFLGRLDALMLRR